LKYGCYEVISGFVCAGLFSVNGKAAPTLHVHAPVEYSATDSRAHVQIFKPLVFNAHVTDNRLVGLALAGKCGKSQVSKVTMSDDK